MSAASVRGGVGERTGRAAARVATAVVFVAALLLVLLPVRGAGGLVSDEGVRLVPEGTTRVGNCIPFGDNSFGFSGFVYRDVPAFSMRPGTRFAFDLGGVNDVDVRRNIFFAPTDRDPDPADPGVRAVDWTQVASEEQVPENPRGNTVKGDYELAYTAESDFAFGGGGLAVGFGAAPPGAYLDRGCDRVVVHTTRSDPSGYFYARFWNRDHLTLGALDTGWDTSSRWLAGMVVLPDVRTVEIDVRPGSERNPVNLRSRGVLPVAVLSETDFDAPSEVVRGSLTFGATGEESSLRHCGSSEDVDGDGLEDLVCHFALGATGFTAQSTEGVLRGRAGGDTLTGRDALDVLATKRP